MIIKNVTIFIKIRQELNWQQCPTGQVRQFLNDRHGVNRNMFSHAKTTVSVQQKEANRSICLSVPVTSFRYALPSTKAELVSVRKRKLQRGEST